MLNIKVDDKGSKNAIEKALKQYKNKVRDTKMMDKLREKKEYKKKSVKRREEINKAVYVEKKFKSNDQ